MSTNCDLLDRLARNHADYVRLHPRDRTKGAWDEMTLSREAHERIIMLERIVDRYGDKIRMAMCNDAEMQFVIDVALENQAGRRGE